jgi:hypothetical protein
MLRLIVVAFAALCVIGTSSLALAEDAMNGKLYGDQREPGKSSGEGARYADQRESVGQGAQYADQIEPARADDAMKGKTKEHKEKMKAHKDAANAAPAAPAPAAKP